MAKRPYDIDPEEAYRRYVALGPARSLLQLSTVLAGEGQPVPLKTLESWSRKYRWQARLEHAAAIGREETDRLVEQQLGEHRRQRRRVANGLIAQGCAALLRQPIEELKPIDATRLIQAGLALERELQNEMPETPPAADTTIVVDLDAADAASDLPTDLEEVDP